MHNTQPEPFGASHSGPHDANDLAAAPWPICGHDEQQAVLRVLQSGQLNYWTGEEGKLFESEFAQFVGSAHALTVANGTVGLELALAALEIGPGDEVIVPSRTFIATASAVVARGAIPICADVDVDSQNLTADTIRPHLTQQTRAVVPVHLAGWPSDMEPILELAREHDLRVIEDCAQAHGARYRGHHVGTLGDMGVFSFCQDKIMTTGGEGGMVVTNNEDLWQNAWSFRDHGKCYDAVHREHHPAGFRWLHTSFGTNMRMTEMQSAIGRVTLRKLPHWVELRQMNAAIVLEALQEIDALRTPMPSGEDYHAYYKLYTFVKPRQLQSGWDRDRIMRELNDRGVPCFSGACSEIYLEDAFPRELKPTDRLPVARELGETSLMFLVHPTLTPQAMQKTAQAIQTVMRQAAVAQPAVRVAA